MRSDRLPFLRAFALTALVLALGGCAVERTVLEDSAAETLGAPDDELDFWDDLATRSVVTNHDAIHGLLLAAGTTSDDDFAARLEAARHRGWIGEDENPDPNESASVGMISYAVCDILDIDGGVTMRIFGPSRRYCTRELVFLKLIPLRTEAQSLTGLEFIDLMGRIDDWRS
jgi:hypothetical protein